VTLDIFLDAMCSTAPLGRGTYEKIGCGLRKPWCWRVLGEVSIGGGQLGVRLAGASCQWQLTTIHLQAREFRRRWGVSPGQFVVS